MNKYFGKKCDKHPDLMGERYKSNFGCVACVKKTSYDRQKKVRLTKDGSIFYMLNRAKQRAKNKKIEFSISLDDLYSVWPQDDKCPVFKVPFFFGRRNKILSQLAPSLDRINNSKGYVRGNIQIISMRANRVKSCLSKEELLNISEWIIKTQNY